MKPVDPVHFFSSRGKSMLTQDHQEEMIRRLLLENKRLKKLLQETTGALKAKHSAPISANSEILH